MQNELQRSWEVLVVVVSALVCIKEGVCALWALSQDVLGEGEAHGRRKQCSGADVLGSGVGHRPPPLQ